MVALTAGIARIDLPARRALANPLRIVLNAFQNVADTLEALKSDADALTAAVKAEAAAKTSLDIAKRQLSLGAVNYLILLNAEQAYEQAYEQAIVNRVQAQSARFADTRALYQALGGGWWNRQDVAAVDSVSAGISSAGQAGTPAGR